ncbi:hypothetical protein SO802_024254 [Lithocarpus litseifolius]|uniref:Scarecrow-like protein 8 n=1 Tax=Lithocarpus litseifolius TaxID=425828 RepID=A0AAW2C8R0_9ROSI
MASGFTGGGAPDFFTGRSTNQAPQHSYRSNLPGLFLDPSTQIARHQQQLQQQPQQPHTIIGKRTLSDYQAHQFQNHQAGLNGFFYRNVKPRTYTSPISPLSPMDFSAATTTPSSLERLSLPILHQLRPQPISIGNRIVAANNNTQALPGVPCVSASSSHVSEQKIMNDRLQELEKQLLDDDDDATEEENDAVSVITNANSEWSETIQNLISPTSQKPPISLSPTSSSSSSSSSSVASPSSACSKQCIIDAATNISEGKSQVASEILARLARLSNPKGNSEERLMRYWVSALKSRVNSVENPPPVGELFNKEHVESTQLLYDMSPCFTLGFMAANLGILEATLDESDTKSDNNNHGNKIHVIDFDIGQVGQYVYLLQALSARQNGKSFIVKITAVVADNSFQERLTKVGNALTQEAKKVGVCFTFKTVMILKLGELTRESLGCEPDESLVVNFAFKLYRMADESVSTDNPRDELLRRVKGLGPRVVILVEQEMNTNTAPFMARVTETCSYYGALFDSFEATMKRDNSERVKIEEGLSRKLGNSVACEGRDRVERCEVFGKWRARMGMAGFELKPLSQHVSEAVKAKLTAENRVNPGFTVTDQNGGVCIGWMGRTLTVASAWR